MNTELELQEEGYKQTKLGLLPKEWEVEKLVDLSEMIVPQRNKPKAFDGNIPWIRIEDFDGKYIFGSKSNQKVSEDTIRKMHLRPYPIDTVLCSCSGNMGICAITKEILVSNQTFIGITPNQKLDTEYLYYLLGFSRNRIKILGTGVTIHYVSKNKFKTFEIPLPPISEQKNIAYVLSTIQETIEKTGNIINSLQELKKSLMKHLFAYGAVNRKETEKIKLKDTEIGKLNEGWEVSKLEGVAEIIMGQSPKGETYNTQGNGVPLINGPTEYGARYPHVIQWTTTPTKLCQKGDILFCVRGNTLGRLNIADATYCIGRGVAAIRGIQNVSDTMFLYYFLEMKAAAIYSMCIGVNSTFPNISGANLRKIAVSKPPVSIQQQIGRILSCIDVKIETEEKRKEALNELFKSMLHNLMSAKIRVNNFGG